MLSKLFIVALAAVSMGSVWACPDCEKHGTNVSFDADDSAPVHVGFDSDKDDGRFHREGHFHRDGRFHSHAHDASFEGRHVRFGRRDFVSSEDYSPVNPYSYTKPAAANRLQNEADIEWDDCDC
ncbi:MAG TPA: hypothetical protein VEK08_06715 [Planctomycetota bacterium]|nr:hypothetical protein [Planctomycetota bacterium]